MLRESVTRGQAFETNPASVLFPMTARSSDQSKRPPNVAPAASNVKVGCIRLAHVAGATHIGVCYVNR